MAEEKKVDKVECPVCNGSRSVHTGSGDMLCYNCNGTGYVDKE